MLVRRPRVPLTRREYADPSMLPPTTTNAASRSSRRPRVALSSVCLVLGWTLALGPAGLSSAAAGFRQSGIEGGGFVNVIAADPTGSGVMIAGGDVSGLHRSTNFGDTWTQVNIGISGIDQLKVAAVAFSPTTPGEIYAGVGDEGRNGGVLVSTDAGRTWELRSTAVQFSGGNNDGWPTLPQKHPRSTGRLFAFDPGRDLVYAATFERGVYRSADHGYTWTPLGASGRFLRGLAIDPANPDVLYAAAYGEGIYKTTDASATGTFTKLAFAPPRPEELLMVGSDLFAAAGSGGIFTSANGGANWSRLGGATVPSGPVWMSIDGYEACGTTVLYAGAERGNAAGVLRSVDGGTTWTSLVGDPMRMHDEIGGAGGDPWWLYKPNIVPGGSFYSPAAIELDPSPPEPGACVRDTVFLAGRSGVWRATDGGTEWYPAVAGLGVSIARAVAFDPSHPGRLYTAMADWVHLYSIDGGDRVTQRRPPGGATAFDVEFGATPSPARVFLATGSPTANTGGEVYSSTNTLSGGWVDEGLSAVAHGARPLAIGVRQVGTQRVLLVATEGDGIWRKAGSVWTQVSTAAMQGFQGTHTASLVWPRGPFVYLFDHDSGIWRSPDNGRTWARVWTRRSGSQLTGFLAADPRVPDRLYVSVANQGVFRIDDADGSGLTGDLVPTPIGSFSSPGAIAVDPSGALYVATVAQGGPARLYRSTDRGATFETVSDAVWASTGGFVYDLEVAPNGELYAATNGNGLLRGVPTP